MKKLFLFAATAMLFAACTSEDVVAPQTGQVADNNAVGFDVYVPGATQTRAGYEGALTTTRLQDPTAGFGVYAFYSDQASQAAHDGDYGYVQLNTDAGLVAAVRYVPNFMVNEKVTWTDNAWGYSPLKYWPNETENDSQVNPDPAYMERNVANDKRLDRLTFFAYAPYVLTPGTPGITAVTANNGKITPTKGDATAILTDPSVEYVAAFKTGDGAFATSDPNKGVDLLWGVAPSGGLNYTAVNGTTVSKAEGLPLIDMTKPDVNTNMKFLFEHALARFGVKVAAAVDQLAQGGTLDPNTKITINKVKLTGYFGDSGILNLNNGKQNEDADKPVGAHNANWMRINTVDLVHDLAYGTFLDEANKRTIVIEKTDATHTNIAPHLQYQGTYDVTPDPQNVVGVTTTLQDLINPSSKYFNKVAGVPAYDPAKPYYTSPSGGAVARAEIAAGTTYLKDGKYGFFYLKDGGHFVKQTATVYAPEYPEYIYGASSTLYFVKPTPHVLDGNEFTGGDLYEIDNSSKTGDSPENAPTFSYKDVSAYDAAAWAAENGNVYYTLEDYKLPLSEVPFKYAAGTYYAAERNFFMVVPTDNLINNLDATTKDAWVAAGKDVKLRTITVEIEYYITTEDSKLSAERSQTKNVVTKNVVLPHIKNGQSYNLNLILGLTSVKVEAEVADWQVTNVNGYLPQNTAGE